MDITQIKADVLTWAKNVTGMPCAWADDPQSMQVKLPARIELEWTTLVNVGQDWLQYAENVDGDMVPTVVGNREFSVTVRAVSRSQAGNSTGQFFVEKLRTSLKKPSVLGHFQASEIAIVRMGPAATYKQVFDGRAEAVAAAELRLAAAIADSDIPAGRIAQVEVRSELKDSVGQLLAQPPNGTQVIETT